jgi:hypothetical protein
MMPAWPRIIGGPLMMPAGGARLLSAGRRCKGGQDFDGPTERTFSEHGPRGLVPARGLGLEPLVRGEWTGDGAGAGETDSARALAVALADAPLAELEAKCAELGCVAFSSRSLRFFGALVEPRKWVASEDPEDQVYVMDTLPPWHLADTLLSFGDGTVALQSVSVEVDFLMDVPRCQNLYICLLGGHTSHGAFYAGLQTNVGAPSCAERGPRVRPPGSAQKAADCRAWPPAAAQPQVEPEMGAIFSRWGPAAMEDVAVPDTSLSFAEAAGYEGDFASVRRHLRWGKGRYRFSLLVDADAQKSRGLVDEPAKAGTWVRCQVDDLGTGASHIVGWLFFRGEGTLALHRDNFYQFFEIYGERVPVDVDHYSPLRYVASNLRINGALVPTPSSTVLYYKHVPLIAHLKRDLSRSDWHVVTDFCVPNQQEPVDYGSYKLWP